MKWGCRSKSRWLAFLVAVVTMSGATWVRAASEPGPMEVIRAGTDRVLEVLNLGEAEPTPERIKQRREEIREIAYDFVNFEEMSKRALGRHWKKISPQERDEFMELFQKLLYNTYIDQVDTYTGGVAEIHYDQERVEGDYAQVKTRISYKEAEIPVEYRLVRTDGKWLVYDVVIEGVSFVNNYRKQFDAMLTNRSFDHLLSVLRDKIAQLEKS